MSSYQEWLSRVFFSCSSLWTFSARGRIELCGSIIGYDCSLDVACPFYTVMVSPGHTGSLINDDAVLNLNGGLRAESSPVASKYRYICRRNPLRVCKFRTWLFRAYNCTHHRERLNRRHMHDETPRLNICDGYGCWLFIEHEVSQCDRSLFVVWRRRSLGYRRSCWLPSANACWLLLRVYGNTMDGRSSQQDDWWRLTPLFMPHYYHETTNSPSPPTIVDSLFGKKQKRLYPL